MAGASTRPLIVNFFESETVNLPFPAKCNLMLAGIVASALTVILLAMISRLCVEPRAVNAAPRVLYVQPDAQREESPGDEVAVDWVLVIVIPPDMTTLGE